LVVKLIFKMFPTKKFQCKPFGTPPPPPPPAVQSGTCLTSLCLSEISSLVNSFALTSPQIWTLTTWHSTVPLRITNSSDAYVAVWQKFQCLLQKVHVSCEQCRLIAYSCVRLKSAKCLVLWSLLCAFIYNLVVGASAKISPVEAEIHLN
jgi:hypothetical protein